MKADTKEDVEGELCPNHGADLALITLCDRLTVLRNRELSFISVEYETEEEYEAVDKEWWEVSAKIQALGAPTTLAGAVAMARAVHPHISLQPDGDPTFLDIAETLSIRIVEFLTGRAVT